MSSEPEVLVSASAAELASAVAARAVATLAAAVTERGIGHLVVTGGSILEKVLAELGAPSSGGPLDWAAVHVWWGDERYVAADSADRNDLPALTAVFDRVPAVLHRMPADTGASAEAAAEAYATQLTGFGDPVPAFDVILLGLGPDGHCASLFPGHPGLLATGSVIAIRDSPKPPPVRLSLTFEALDAAREIWFIASGDGKADAVARAVGGDPAVPSSKPRGTDRTLWLVDRDAASRLS